MSEGWVIAILVGIAYAAHRITSLDQSAASARWHADLAATRAAQAARDDAELRATVRDWHSGLVTDDDLYSALDAWAPKVDARS